LTETQQLEHYLLGTGNPADHIVMEARLQLDPNLALHAAEQQMAYRLVQLHGRMQIRAMIAKVDAEVFESSRFTQFRRKIQQIFTSK
jgi:anti-sigma factor RsiW